MNVAFVIINFNTPKLFRFCLKSLLDCYPNESILLIDNGSNDISYQKYMSIHHKNITCLFNSKNITHGPAMHQAMHLIQTDYVFFLDSDCVVRKPGFLEEMIKLEAYAAGDIQLVNNNGINISDNHKDGIKYVHPSAMLIDRQQYFNLPQFIAHGAPCIENMIQANMLDYKLVDYPIDDYVIHFGRGTREGLNVTWNGESKKRIGFWQRLLKQNTGQ